VAVAAEVAGSRRRGVVGRQPEQRVNWKLRTSGNLIYEVWSGGSARTSTTALPGWNSWPVVECGYAPERSKYAWASHHFANRVRHPGVPHGCVHHHVW
jgi:hypothetical protein